MIVSGMDPGQVSLGVTVRRFGHPPGMTHTVGAQRIMTSTETGRRTFEVRCVRDSHGRRHRQHLRLGDSLRAPREGGPDRADRVHGTRRLTWQASARWTLQRHRSPSGALVGDTRLGALRRRRSRAGPRAGGRHRPVRPAAGHRTAADDPRRVGLAAWFFPGLGLALALLVGATLAPTDAALGSQW